MDIRAFSKLGVTATSSPPFGESMVFSPARGSLLPVEEIAHLHSRKYTGTVWHAGASVTANGSSHIVPERE